MSLLQRTAGSSHRLARPGNADTARYTARCRVRSGAARSSAAVPGPAHHREHHRRDHIEAQAAFNASLERIVSATSSVAGSGAALCVEETLPEIARLALLHSTQQRRFSHTHINTVNMSMEEDDSPSMGSPCEQLPMSQLAFKALLRASLAAARLNHSCLTTPHILLGLVSVAAAPHNPLAAAAPHYAEAEAAVTAMIDGPAGAPVSAAAGAAASLLGTSQGLHVVTWCGQLSSRAQQVLQDAERQRQQQGHPLLTSSHLLSTLLHESDSSPRPWVGTLLVQLGLDREQVYAQLAAQLQGLTAAAAAAAAAGPGRCAAAPVCGEDGVACELVGFLHEEVYKSLARTVSPSAPAAYSLN